MKKAIILITVLAITMCLFVPIAIANTDRTLIILDCSSAMRAEVKGERMIYIAKKELIGFVERLKSDSIVGIMVFGHTDDRCDDAELIFPFGSPDSTKVRDSITPVANLGSRGLFHAMKKGMKLLAESKENPVMYVITSGNDQCGDRIYGVQDAFEEYGNNTRIVIIGLDVDSRDSDNLKELASIVNGTYKDVPNPQKLVDELAGISQSQHGNLVIYMRGGDQDVPMGTLRIYNDRAGLLEKLQIKGMHTMNLSPGTYNIELTYKGRNFWERNVEIGRDTQKQVMFKLDKKMGELKLEIVDVNSDRMKGSVVIMDEDGNIVFEGDSRSNYRFSLSSGFYSGEVNVGDFTEFFDYIEIFDNGVTDLIIPIAILPGKVEVVINNFDGIPVNASIVIEDENGNIIGESEFTSNYKTTLPPGNYTALITTSNGRQESYPFYLPEGDNLIVPVEIDAPMGAVLVYLNDTNADEVYGYLKVFDERGRAIPHFEWESIEDSHFTFDLPVGMYRIQASSGGILRTVDNVHVSEFDETIIEITFPKVDY